MNDLHLYNTLTEKKEIFTPRRRVYCRKCHDDR